MENVYIILQQIYLENSTPNFVSIVLVYRTYYKKNIWSFFLDTVYIIIIINTAWQVAGAAIAELEWLSVSFIHSFNRTVTDFCQSTEESLVVSDASTLKWM